MFMYIIENNKKIFFVIKLFLVYLVPDGSHIINFVESSITLEAYLSDTTKPGTWGTHIELQAIASLLNVALCIITNREEQENAMIWMCPQWKDTISCVCMTLQR